MAESKLVRTSLIASIISPILFGLMFVFTLSADGKINENGIQDNKERIEKVIEEQKEIKCKQEEQTDDIQANKETNIRIEGEIKNINEKLDNLNDLVKDVKNKLDGQN